MHILTVHVSQTVKDIASIIVVVQYEAAYGLSIFFILAKSKGQGQGYAHFNCEYL